MAKQRSSSQQAYCQSVGTSPTGAPIIDIRDPNVNDVFYPIGQFWINQIGIRLFYLNTQSNVTGKLQSTWQLLSVQSTIASISDTANLPVFASSTIATPPANIQLLAGSGISVISNPGLNLLTISNTGVLTESLTGDDTVAVSSIAGTIRTLGNTVANATFAKALFTNNPSTNIEQFNIQVATKLAATDATLSKVGLSVFSSAQFNVDANGFVTLIGGSTSPMLSITPNTFTAPGTSPTLPNGTGTLTVQGGTHFVTGTQAFPIRTDSLAANTINIEIQEAGSNPAVSTANNFGVAQFDSNQFNVASGFVQLVGGSVSAIQTITGNDLVAISGSGTPRNVNIIGAGSITTSGAVSTETISLTGLTNHAVLVGAGTSTITKVGPTATIGQVLQSAGIAADPAYSTATYPVTTTINQILYSSAINTVTGLATVNNSILSTNNTGVPSFVGPLTNGQLLIGSTGAQPVVASLTAGTGITITAGAGSITISTNLLYTNVNFAASPYTVLTTDQYISCDSSAGAVILLFPNSTTSFKTWVIKDRLGKSSTNAISITTVGGAVTIDAQTTYKIISNYGAVNLLFNAVSYEIY